MNEQLKYADYQTDDYFDDVANNVYHLLDRMNSNIELIDHLVKDQLRNVKCYIWLKIFVKLYTWKTNQKKWL